MDNIQGDDLSHVETGYASVNKTTQITLYIVDISAPPALVLTIQKKPPCQLHRSLWQCTVNGIF